jgi:hypothetical protein
MSYMLHIAVVRHAMPRNFVDNYQSFWEPRFLLLQGERLTSYSQHITLRWLIYTKFSYLRPNYSLHHSFKHSMTSAVFWGNTRRRVVIFYRRFGTTYRSHPHGSRVLVGKPEIMICVWVELVILETVWWEKYLVQGSNRKITKDTYKNLYNLINFTQCSQGSSVSIVTRVWLGLSKARISIPYWA